MYEMLLEHMRTNIPFAGHARVALLTMGPGVATARLEDEPEVKNHIGSQHAGALFTLGESASGAAMAGAFAAKILELRPVAATAQIKYEKVAHGPITAHAEVSRPASELLEELEREGKVRFDVNVSMLDAEEEQVASLVVNWYVSPQR